MIYKETKTTHFKLLKEILILNLLINLPFSKSTKFNPVNSWPESTVSNLQVFGSGIAIDKNNNVILLHRGEQINSGSFPNNELIPVDTVFILDGTSGKILRTWGKNKFVKPHGIEVIDNGDIFITDVTLHQVFKFEYDQSTKVWNDTAVLTLGKRFISGNDAYHFCSPADVAIMPESGDFFVADGYCNSRVVKFNRLGKYLQEFSAGSANPTISPVPFNVSHSLAIAFPRQFSNAKNSKVFTNKYNEDNALVFVADRNNGRVQSFSINGTFQYEISFATFGKEKAMLLSVVHINSNSFDYADFDYGILYAVNGHLPFGQPKVFQFGLSKMSAKLISFFPVSQFKNNSYFSQNIKFETPHDIEVTRDGKNIYIVEAVGNLTMRKFASIESEGSLPVLSLSLISSFIFYVLFLNGNLPIFLFD